MDQVCSSEVKMAIVKMTKIKNISEKPIENNSENSTNPVTEKKSQNLKVSLKCNKIQSLKNGIQNVLFDPNYCSVMTIIIIYAELCVNCLLLKYIPVNCAYLDQYLSAIKPLIEENVWSYSNYVSRRLATTSDFYNYPTGRFYTNATCAYPPGHIYMYTLIYYITGGGKIKEYIIGIHLGIYITTLYMVGRIFCKTKKIPPYVLLLVVCSFRSHVTSIYTPSNDTLAVLCIFICFNCILNQWWKIAAIVFCLGVSIKLSVLYYAPAVLLLHLHERGKSRTYAAVGTFFTFQIFLATPFIYADFGGIFASVFNYGFYFRYIESVNWQFIPRSIFFSPYFHSTLSFLYLIILILFVEKIWLRALNEHGNNFSDQDLVHRSALLLFSSNLIGILFSRSLHLNHYCWYNFSLPYLLWSTSYSEKSKLTLLFLIEICWNVDPPTIQSSTLLLFIHLIILYDVFNAKLPSEKENIENKTDEKEDKKIN